MSLLSLSFGPEFIRRQRRREGRGNDPQNEGGGIMGECEASPLPPLAEYKKMERDKEKGKRRRRRRRGFLATHALPPSSWLVSPPPPPPPLLKRTTKIE